MNTPNFKDVLVARKRIESYVTRTPLYEYGRLSDILNCKVFVKHENYQLTRAFKIRGGINLISRLNDKEKERGVITASTGNHGQSIALASKMFDVTAIICVPDKANPDKIYEIKRYGAKIVEEGRDFEDAKQNAERLAKKEGYRYIHSGNEPLLIAGVATYVLEIFEDKPDLDVLYVPVGGGSGASGAGIVINTVSPDTKLIGVQAKNAPSVYRSWKSNKIIPTESADTIADGLATRKAFELPLKIMRKHIDDFVLVSEKEIKNAIRIYFEKAHTIAEGAGAAPLAAAIKNKKDFVGKNVGLVLSGGNITAEMLRKIL